MKKQSIPNGNLPTEIFGRIVSQIWKNGQSLVKIKGEGLMKRSQFFNKNSICIFTDASFVETSKGESGNSSIGSTAPAFAVYQDDTLINQGFHILHNATSQQGELYALFLAVSISKRYKGSQIRIFSDSQTSVLGVRDRLFNWIEETNRGKKALGTKGRISNQLLLMKIADLILYNDLPIEVYHIKGHVNVARHANIVEAKELFVRSNGFSSPDEIDDDLIFQLALGNNYIDNYSTIMLHQNLHNPIYNNLTEILECGYTPAFDINKYETLVNRVKNGSPLASKS